MHTLSLNFMILQLCGMWRPLVWSSGWKSVLYDSYTTFMIISVYTFAISELIDLVVSFENVEEFTRGSLILLTMIGVCGKTVNVVKKRNEIIKLTNVLKKKICTPRNAGELKIQIDCDRSARWNTRLYSAFTGSTASFILLRSLLLDIPERNLPFKAWLPFHLDSSKNGFWFAYFHQFIASGTAAVVNSSFDTLVPGLMMQACAQMKILKYRIESIPEIINEKKKSIRDDNDEEENRRVCRSFEYQLLTQCIRHHIEIFQFADTSIEIFGLVVFLQFFVSSLVLCVSVYELSKMNLFSAEFVATAMYLNCMLVQIFIFCFYGGELTLQSIDISDAVYRMDWTSFGKKSKKCLMIMMMRSLRPITFTCANIITLSLDSFNSLIKLSYSAYNFLQRSSE